MPRLGLTAAILLAASLVPVRADAAAGPRLEGLWRTEGYGLVLSVEGSTVTLLQTTAISCLRLDQGERVAPSTYRLSDGTTTISLRVDRGRPGRGIMRAGGSTGYRSMTRLRALPEPCGRKQPSGPLGTFDVFWQTFAENYPFFRRRHIDWAAARQRYRPLVTEKTLFGILRDMIRPLHDAHTAVIAGDRVFMGQRPGTRNTTVAFGARTKAYIQRRDLHGAGRDHAAGQLTYADLPDGLGYLRVAGFYGYTDGEDLDYPADRRALTRALDAILTPGRAPRGLVIDVRFNPGGFDALALQLASRLTARPYVAYSKRARDDPRDPTSFTPPQPITVTPARAHRYTGPIALLTSGTTNSAGETFTQALMDRPGGVVRIGQNTQGVFSDVMECPLPNGWTFWVPNEEYLTREGTTFDGTGIPPDLRTPVFTPAEFAEGRDSAFDRAVAVLSKRAPSDHGAREVHAGGPSSAAWARN
ncbi:S41 family peptidase [Nonomuraea pusilla]|uniref:Peptidase family S41 n=1 Tax=Nonomuraea pusilla TaxID=46177 RepID=A0A1H7YBD5_9ACTN|nr:S41 family peptidase [Nonomuraea pusilla]SEM42648.1 Peptidase family S41 [Nonomuraea pusilla]